MNKIVVRDLEKSESTYSPRHDDVGSIWFYKKPTGGSSHYILAQTGLSVFSMVGLCDGNRYSDAIPLADMRLDSETWTKITKARIEIFV
jgi:hypothetical protein